MRRHHSVDFIVGLFVLAGVISFLLLSLKVSGLQEFSLRDDSLTIKASFANIGGLKQRSRVTIGGVNVGRVKSIILDTQEESYDAIVEMSLRSELIDKIPDDSTASIRTAGLIGDNFIAIIPGGSEEYLAQGDYVAETNSALVLEELINKYLFSKTQDDDEG